MSEECAGTAQSGQDETGGESLRQEVRALLARYGLRPRKGLGQNFLVERRILERIVEAAELVPDDLVVEVGPGLGFLTRELARRAGHVVAVELDRQLATLLGEPLAGFGNVQIIQGDILDMTPAQLLSQVPVSSGHPYKVVANLPYYITSPVLRHFLEAPVKPRLIVVMVQKEVAQRICSRPPEMSLLSISVQVYGRPTIVRHVPAGAFYPVPEVDSSVLRINVYNRPAVDVDDMDRFFQLVSAGFSQPRKQIHNSLSQRLWFPPGGARAVLERAGIDPQRRPQTLSLAEWEKLYHEWQAETSAADPGA